MASQGELQRQLGLVSAVALVVGEVIGVGIFLTPAGMAKALGSPFWLFVDWLAMGALLVASGTFVQILAYFIFPTVAFLELTIAAVFVLRRRSLAPTIYRTPGYPVTPLLFLLPIVFLLVLLAVDNPGRTLLGVGVVALGVPVYYMMFRRGK